MKIINNYAARQRPISHRFDVQFIVNSNGVIEEEHHEKKIALLALRILMLLGPLVIRCMLFLKRNAEGRENTLGTLHNLTEEEAVKFNETWKRQAVSSIPGSRNRSHMLD
eukprot:Gb_12062 [translate_table: standard]